MHSRTWATRSIILSLITAMLVVVGVAAPPTGSVEASNQRRVSATSPTTGVTYTLVYSCMAQFPSATASRPDQDVFTKLEILVDGEVFRDVNDRVDHRSDDNRLNFQRKNQPLNADGDVTFRLRDAVIDGDVEFGPPFLTLVPDPCPDYSPAQRGAFTPIAPERVLDTRSATAINYSGSKPAANSSVKIPAAVMPERPDDVLAVSLTVTMVQPAGPSFAQVYPAGIAEPGASSSVNTTGRGVNIANGAVVPVADDGSISVFVSGSTHVLVDINGYFVSQTGPVTAGRLETIDPVRVFDTRPENAINYTGAKPGPGSTTTVDLTAGDTGLPDGATAAAVNITVARTSGTGFVQAAASGQLDVGESSVLNVTRVGQSAAGLTIVPVSADGKIDVFTLGGADLIVDLFGWFTGDDAASAASGLFVPLTPERVFDSRRATSLNTNTFTSNAGCCTGSDAGLALVSLEDNASAVFLNTTAIGRGGRGFVRVGGDNRSTFSTVNFGSSGATANATLAPLLPNRGLALHTEGERFARSVALAVDISGYFTR